MSKITIGRYRDVPSIVVHNSGWVSSSVDGAGDADRGASAFFSHLFTTLRSFIQDPGNKLPSGPRVGGGRRRPDCPGGELLLQRDERGAACRRRRRRAGNGGYRSLSRTRINVPVFSFFLVPCCSALIEIEVEMRESEIEREREKELERERGGGGQSGGALRAQRRVQRRALHRRVLHLHTWTWCGLNVG